MVAYAPSAAASFAACKQLFSEYPLAVARHSANGGYLSMVLMDPDERPASFFVLTQTRDDLFVIRSWDWHGEVNQEIRPWEPVPGIVHHLITGGMPVPHDGALLGWVADRQVTGLLVVHCRPPWTWEDQVFVPEIRVMPMAGTCEMLQWPPFTASPLDDGRLWEYVAYGQIVDIVPLVSQHAGRAYWVPSPDRRSVRHGEGSVVILDNMPADEYWLPAGVYMDHWTLREGIGAPPVSHLLGLPGVVDLAYRLG